MTDKQQEILNHLIRLKEVSQIATEELADLRRWIHEEAPRIAVEESRKAIEQANTRAESANRECGEWRERRDLAIIRAEEAEEREDKAIQRAEKVEAERDQLRRGLRQAEQVAQETISILADDHNTSTSCTFNGGKGKDVGCLACLAQDKLGDITVEALIPKSPATNSISPGDGTLRIKRET